MSDSPLHVCIRCGITQVMVQALNRAFCSIGRARHLGINSLSRFTIVRHLLP
jgi:hypothetical protein